mmetsp:Transcript_120869/g.386008  ORF Transcript_120869/g.386008 Transcript_120869/m.386008 type:complete len:287 (+) Transcript_120869:1633-2493(+)
MVQKKVLGILASVCDILTNQPKSFCQLFHLRKQLQAPLQHVVDAAPLREILPGIELRDASTQPKQVPLRDVKSDDLLEEVVQSLIGVSDQNDLLIWEVVEQEVDHLDGRICLTRARRSDDHGETRVHARTDGLDLDRREAHLVLPWLTLRVGSHVRQSVRSGDYILQGPLPRLRSHLVELQAERALQVIGNLDVLGIREGLEDVILVDESITKIDLAQCSGQLPVLRRARVSVAQEQVVQPIWHHSVLRGHKAADGLQDGFEVVLLGLASQHQIQGAVHLLLAIGD